VIGWENACWIACFVLDTGLRAEELRVRGALAERHQKAGSAWPSSPEEKGDMSGA